MTSLPVVQRELIVASRRRFTYLSRSGAAALLAMVAFLLLAFTGNSGPGVTSLPRLTFEILSFILLAFALLGGILLTADSIASERREGTLGLLFLTDLTGTDIALGKLAASSIQGACALVAALPILAIPLMMGGIAAKDYWLTALALIAALLCSAGIGLWASSRARTAASGLLWAVLALLALCLVPTFISWLARHSPTVPDAFLQAELLSPALVIARASNVDNLSPAAARNTAIAVGLVALIGIACLAMAARTLARTGRSGLPDLKATPNTRPLATGKFSALKSSARPSVESAPGWLHARRLPALPALRWILPACLIAWFGFYLAARLLLRSLAQPSLLICMFITYGLHVIYKVRLTLIATAPLSEDIRGGAMELLLSTPLSPRRILAGQVTAVTQAVRSHFWLLIVLGFGLISFIADDDLGITRTDVGPFLTLFVGGMVCVWADTYCIPRLAAFHVLRGHPMGAALTRTLLPILLPPWAGALLFFLLATTAVGNDTATIAFLFIHLTQASLAIFIGFTAEQSSQLNFRHWMASPPVRRM
jgi:ABC-type transport system involved in multi-copper enzyme maturation permease subunit